MRIAVRVVALVVSVLAGVLGSNGVQAAPSVPALQAAAMLTVSPGCGPAGVVSTITASGTDFAPSEKVEVLVDGSFVGGTTTDGSGSFQLPITIGALSPGDHVVTARQVIILPQPIPQPPIIVTDDALYSIPCPLVPRSITVSPLCGPAFEATPIRITGELQGLDPVHISFGGVHVADVPGDVIAHAGAVIAAVRSPAGVYPVRVEANDAQGRLYFGEQPFNVPCSAEERPIAIAPACGRFSEPTPITVSGRLFPRAEVRLTFAGAVMGTVRANRNGDFSAVVPAVPSLQGVYTVRAEADRPGGGVVFGQQPFAVPCEPPTISCEPRIGAPGLVTTATGAGFPPHTPVALTWSLGIPATVSTVTLADGTLRTSVLVMPRDGWLGPRQLRAEYVGGPPPTPAPFEVVPGTASPGGRGVDLEVLYR